MSLDSEYRFDALSAPASPPAVGTPMPGRCVLSQDGHTAVLAPGEFAVLDASRPYRLAFEGIRWVLVAAAPADLAEGRPDELSRIAVTRTGRPPMLLPDAPRELSATGRVEVTSQSSPVPALTPRSDLLRRIHEHMEHNLADPHMSAHSIAAANHISTRYLHKLFKSQGTTVNGWIRGRRLAACKRELTDPRCGHRSIGAIGARWGLAPASYFSRIFKETYGCTPSQVRAMAGVPTDVGEAALRRTG
jgi:AraC-like DNA-binding protein